MYIAKVPNLVPAFNNHPGAESEFKGLAAVKRRIEFFAVFKQSARVVHGQFVALARFDLENIKTA